MSCKNMLIIALISMCSFFSLCACDGENQFSSPSWIPDEQTAAHYYSPSMQQHQNGSSQTHELFESSSLEELFRNATPEENLDHATQIQSASASPTSPQPQSNNPEHMHMPHIPLATLSTQDAQRILLASITLAQQRSVPVTPLAKAVVARACGFEETKINVVAALQDNYKIKSLRKVIYNLKETQHPGICVEVIDAVQDHAQTLQNQKDIDRFEVLTTILKLHALEEGIDLSKNDRSDLCSGKEPCKSQLHTRTLNTSLSASQVFFANVDFTAEEMCLGIKHNIFHATIIQQLGNKYQSTVFRQCMKSVQTHIIDFQKRKAIIDHYMQEKSISNNLLNENIFEVLRNAWIQKMPDLATNTATQLIEQTNQEYTSPPLCDTNNVEPITQAPINNCIECFVNTIASFAPLYSPEQLCAQALNHLEQSPLYPDTLNTYVRSLLGAQNQSEASAVSSESNYINLTSSAEQITSNDISENEESEEECSEEETPPRKRFKQ